MRSQQTQKAQQSCSTALRYQMQPQQAQKAQQSCRTTLRAYQMRPATSTGGGTVLPHNIYVFVYIYCA